MVSSLPPIRESDIVPQAWTDDLEWLQRAEIRDSPRLQQDYHMTRFDFHLSHIYPLPRFPLSRNPHEPEIEEYILSARRNRFFLWRPQETNDALQYTCTPWSLQGLHTALNKPDEELITQVVRKWNPLPPSPESIIPWPFPSLPTDWYTDQDDVMCDHLVNDFRIWDLHNRRPIAFYVSSSGNEDADLFMSDKEFYLYKPFHDELYEVPDLKEQKNLRKLARAPDYEGLELIRLGPAEMFGGRRSLDNIPLGWMQLPWDPEQQVLGLPPRCDDLYKAAVLSTNKGTRHIIEVGYEYYVYFQPERVASRIEAPEGLEQILRTMRLGLSLDLRDP